MAGRVLGQMDRFGLLDGDRTEGAVDTPAHRALAERIATRGTVLLENDGVLPLDPSEDIAGVERSVRELVDFAAVEIPAGERVTVGIDLDERAFAR